MATHGYMQGFDGKDEDDFELSINPVVGVRGFNFKHFGSHGYMLTGYSFSANPWTDGENVAECGVLSKEWGGAPHDIADCSHGYWAYFNEIEEGSGPSQTDIHGIITGYGRTVIGTKGFRCSKAKIEALYVPTKKITVPRQVMVAKERKKTYLRGLYPLFVPLSITMAGLATISLGLTTMVGVLIGVGIMLGAVFLSEILIKFRPDRWVEEETVHDIVREESDYREGLLRQLYPSAMIFYDYDEMISCYPAVKTDHPDNPTYKGKKKNK